MSRPILLAVPNTKKTITIVDERYDPPINKVSEIIEARIFSKTVLICTFMSRDS